MKKLFFLLLAVVFLLSGCKTTSTIEPAPTFTIEPTPVPFAPPPPSPELLLPSGIAYSELAQVIDNFVEKNKDNIAAMSVSVFTARHIILEKSYGYADICGGVANDADTVFEWASITKTLVWVSAMQLVEQGKLDLYADIRVYLPDDFFAQQLYDEPVTMLHLMNHTSGWADDNIARYFVADGEEVLDLEQELRLAEPSQIEKPGVRQEYSNYGAALAGYVVERISGMPFYEYVHANFFEPLGMAHTALKPDLSDNKWVSSQRDKLKAYRLMREIGTERYQRPLYPAAMTAGTIGDLRRYGQALLPDANGASPLFKKVETLEELYNPTCTEFAEQSCHGFLEKLGFADRVIGHTGDAPSGSSLLLLDIDSGIGVAVMTNMVETSLLGNETFLKLIFGEWEESPDDSAAFDASAEMTGSGIRIIWTPEDETTGYWIYRAMFSDALGMQLNEKPIVGGEYIDKTAGEFDKYIVDVVDPDNTTYYYTIVKDGSYPSTGLKVMYRK